jgi:hypothetical protein
LRFHVSAHCDHQTQRLNGQAAKDENGTRAQIRGRKQNERGNRQEEPGWQYEQSRESHGRSLFEPGT